MSRYLTAADLDADALSREIEIRTRRKEDARKAFRSERDRLNDLLREQERRKEAQSK